MARRPSNTVTFLSDYGSTDGFVGVVHLVIAGVAPEVRVVDLGHGVAVHDVAGGARMLVRAAPWLSKVVLAVVDPGVGTARRSVAVEAVDGSGRPAVLLVGPDNGLLVPATRAIGGFGRAVSLDDSAWHARFDRQHLGNRRRGATFDGRDVFAPVAAHLAAGVDLALVGSAIDPAGLVGFDGSAERAATALPDGSVAATIRWIDRFGNAQLDVAPALTAGWGAQVAVGLGDGRTVAAVVVVAYQDLVGDGLGLMVDSEGWLSLVRYRGSAAAILGLAEGDGLVLAPRPPIRQSPDRSVP